MTAGIKNRTLVYFDKYFFFFNGNKIFRIFLNRFAFFFFLLLSISYCTCRYTAHANSLNTEEVMKTKNRDVEKQRSRTAV